MIGIFDSGLGGLAALREYRRLVPSADILFFADRENAPYGTKSEAELLELTAADINKLRSSGAEKILMACCTASTVYEGLAKSEKSIAVPIIAPTAHSAAKLTKNGKIAVIATERTVLSHAFTNSVKNISPDISVTEYEAQRLVFLVESGVHDGNTDGARQEISEILAPLSELDFDCLILGCTHFSHLAGEISRLFPGVSVVDSAHEGARELARLSYRRGKGRTIYL